MALPTGLLEASKNYLDMTWTLTAEETAKLTGIIERGISRIDRYAGAAQDYAREGDAKALLLDYVRYVRSNALDEFETNYLHDLLALQMHTEVTADDTQPPENTDP